MKILHEDTPCHFIIACTCTELTVMILSSDVSGLNVLRWTTRDKWHPRYARHAGFPLGHLAVMDVTEPKEIRAARERLDPRDPAGAEGKKGDRGESGAQGPAGQKGQRGEKGESGTPGSPQLSSHMNWKECSWKNGDGKDSGVIHASGLRHEITMYPTKFCCWSLCSQ